MADRLVPAFYVEVFARTADGAEVDAYGYAVAADDGRVLFRRNMTAYDAFQYRVWADPDGDKRPLDGPIADFTPHPTGVPDGSYPAFVAPVLVSIDGFNANADPWLAAGATQTKGNNVDAYTDHDLPDGFSAGDVRATVTSPGVFDRVYDPSLEPLASEEQSMASVTQLFYVTNWLHDYWYDSGFDEPSGNAQLDNYGRGGEAGDPLHAEAQDGALTGLLDNANMYTPEDGESPRMQMYVWAGANERTLEVPAAGGSLPTGGASFGPANFSLSGALAAADDGVIPGNDACEPIQNDVSAKIAIIHRGTCSFESKALAAQTAGAIAVVLVNNQPGGPPNMPAAGLGGVSIPTVSVSDVDGAALEAALAVAPLTATLTGVAGVQRDGTLDNLVVAHEWGHYLHHRLVFCGLQQCGGMSEGWADFTALTTALRPEDDLHGAFGAAIYATAAESNAAYFGIRRMPYSVDPAINPLTFRHVQTGEPLPDDVPIVSWSPDNAEVHNTGEIWASMLFEGYVRLLEESKKPSPEYTFDEARRRMADYVVMGMKMAPTEPSFVEQRDAVLAAAFAADPEDALLLAEGFAKRGAGSCAVSPPSDSFDNVGVVESFEVASTLVIGELTLDDGVVSCDDDGLLDAGETGRISFEISNRSIVGAPGTQVTISSPTAGVTFPGGSEVATFDLAAFESKTVTVEVALGPSAGLPDGATVEVTAGQPDACQPVVERARLFRVDYDAAEAASTSDAFESGIDVWTRAGDAADVVWAWEQAEDALGHVWHGVDISGITDTALVSPPVEVAAVGNLVLAFSHRHSFEVSPEDPSDPTSPLIFWDGAVVEISTDGDQWIDVADLGDPGYGGAIGDLADNPLADRQAYVAQNAGWPGSDAVQIDLGSSLAGQTVQVRFRIATDQAAGEYGWDIDDVAFSGAVGTPFPAVAPNAATCAVGQPPLADAGADQSVPAAAAVTLDASGSSDPDGDALTFTWAQTAGPSVELSTSGATAAFTAPEVAETTTLTFEVTVDTADGTDTDTVNIEVAASGGSGSAGSDFSGLAASGGCGCRTTPAQGRGGAALAMAVGLLMVRRRRRPLG
ncbi:MAG: M36 family metallopeptidase [Polyangiaceae bacterium]